MLREADVLIIISSEKRLQNLPTVFFPWNSIIFCYVISKKNKLRSVLWNI
jgi:undecaprenyl pyrophosphate synthase